MAGKTNLKVGDVAQRTGITVRTLHHYEEIGLLPAVRNESGHRVYTESDLQRLQQILSLRQLGFSLEMISQCFSERSISVLETVRMHQKKIQQERDQLTELAGELATLEKILAAQGEPSGEQLLSTIGVIHMHEKYFNKEQLQELKSRDEALGPDKMKEYQDTWTKLMDKVRAEAKKQVDPGSAEVQILAQQWSDLVAAFTGGNAEIEVRLGSMYRNEPAMRQKAGLDPELYEYVAKMMSYFHKRKGG